MTEQTCNTLSPQEIGIISWRCVLSQWIELPSNLDITRTVTFCGSVPFHRSSYGIHNILSHGDVTAADGDGHYVTAHDLYNHPPPAAATDAPVGAGGSNLPNQGVGGTQQSQLVKFNPRHQLRQQDQGKVGRPRFLLHSFASANSPFIFAENRCVQQQLMVEVEELRIEWTSGSSSRCRQRQPYQHRQR